MDNFDQDPLEQQVPSAGPPASERPLGRVVDAFALLAAGGAAIGSLFTSFLFSLAGATDMNWTQMLLTAAGVAVGMYLIVLFGGRLRDRGL